MKMVCDGCGIEADVPVRTIADLADVATRFLARLRPLLLVKAPGDTLIDVKCPRCSSVPPAPGVLRVGEF
jgi:hypothetical protein